MRELEDGETNEVNIVSIDNINEREVREVIGANAIRGRYGRAVGARRRIEA